MAAEPKVNILLVDDEPANLLALEAVLAGLGQNLVRACSGNDALRHLLHDDFALVILDVRMPDLDGLETAALIRARQRTRHVPIVFVTGQEPSDADLVRAYSLGAVDFLIKPVVPEVLCSKAAVFVELARMTQQLRHSQQQEHERRLAQERQRWEVERLREEAAREKLAEERARVHAHRQERLAGLGQRALVGLDTPALLAEAAYLVAAALGTEWSAVFELLPDGRTLRLRAGAGWPEGWVGYAVLLAAAGAPAHVLLAEQPLVCADLDAADAPPGLDLLRAQGVRGGASVIIHAAGRPFGALGVFASRPHRFGRDDVHFLQAVANVLAAALQRRRHEEEVAGLRDELAGQLADMTRLQQRTARLSAMLELPAVLEEALAAVTHLQGADSGALLLLDPERNDLQVAASVGLPAEFLAHVGRVPLGRGLYGSIVAGRRPVVVEDVTADPARADDLDLARRGGFRALCTTPLLTRGGTLIGAIACHFARPYGPPERALRLVELYARQAAGAIDNARLYRALREANQGKDDFLAMLAHELRNPLAPVLNALHVLRRLPADPQAAEETVAMVDRQVRHMAALIDDLLDVSRIGRGKVKLECEPIELGVVVARAVEQARPLIEARGHRLDVAVDAGPVRVLADLTRLEQVLSNLLTNAAKYTDPGGHVRVAARREGGEAVLRVQDTGIGIAAELLPRIFELFMQVQPGEERAQGGLGIGLTLVRRLVEMHGGRIEAHSAGPGRGSEFVVRLPLLEESVPAEETPAPPVRPSQRRRPLRVLVVDDNRDAARSLALVLELDGHKVRVAHDGEAALEMARVFRPEVALLDIGLPGLNGYQVAQELRGRPSGRALLVAMTGYGQEEDRQRSRAAGFDHHLVKPVDPEALRALLAAPAEAWRVGSEC